MVVVQAMEDIQLLAERSGNPVGTGISERKSLLENFNFENLPTDLDFSVFLLIATVATDQRKGGVVRLGFSRAANFPGLAASLWGRWSMLVLESKRRVSASHDVRVLM